MKKTISLLLIFAVYFSLITPIGFQMVMLANAQTVRGKAKVRKNMDNIPNGLTFRLSEGEEGAETREKQPPANADALSENETSSLLKRLPKIKIDEDDKKDFAKRAGSLPPPKTGKKIPVKFPADEERGLPPQNLGDELEVVRFSPEGQINLAPDLSVTFSQPMVAVTSQEGAAQTVPVQLTPNSEGKWRWLGTKTLMFDTTKRFPMATRFVAKVPCRNKVCDRTNFEKRCFVDFYDSAAEG